MRYRYLLAFGSNLDSRDTNCDNGIKLLSPYITIQKSSKRIRSKPLDLTPDSKQQEEYLNFILEVASDLEPAALYEKIREIEDAIGHSRSERYASRHLDIDILFQMQNDASDLKDCKWLEYKDARGLIVPHVAIWQRDFLLQLLSDDFHLTKDWLRARFASISSSEQRP